MERLERAITRLAPRRTSASGYPPTACYSMHADFAPIAELHELSERNPTTAGSTSTTPIRHALDGQPRPRLRRSSTSPWRHSSGSSSPAPSTSPSPPPAPRCLPERGVQAPRLTLGGPLHLLRPRPAADARRAASRRPKMHMRPSIVERQARLARPHPAAATSSRPRSTGLPLASHHDAPSAASGAGGPEVAQNVVERLLRRRLLHQPGDFPAVPMRQSARRPRDAHAPTTPRRHPRESSRRWPLDCPRHCATRAARSRPHPAAQEAGGGPRGTPPRARRSPSRRGIARPQHRTNTEPIGRPSGTRCSAAGARSAAGLRTLEQAFTSDRRARGQLGLPLLRRAGARGAPGGWRRSSQPRCGRTTCCPRRASRPGRRGAPASRTTRTISPRAQSRMGSLHDRRRPPVPRPQRRLEALCVWTSLRRRRRTPPADQAAIVVLRDLAGGDPELREPSSAAATSNSHARQRGRDELTSTDDAAAWRGCRRRRACTSAREGAALGEQPTT